MSIKRPMCVICLAFVFFMYVFLTILGGVDEKEYEHDFSKVQLEGKVFDKVYKNEKYSLHISCNYKDGKKAKYIVYLDEQNAYDFRLGQKVKIEGKYVNFSLPENDGQFDSRKYYRIRGYRAFVISAKVIAKAERYSKIREKLFLVKERTKKIYKCNMGESEAGTLSAMVLGDKTDLDTDVKELYQAAGISHVLSLSGLHIAAVGICIFSMLGFLGISVVPASLISTVIMILYGIMTGLSTSTLRALIMFFLAILARSIGRTYDLLSGMCLASILIIFENPYYVYDSGFLLSVLSVAGISLIYPILIEITDFFKEEKGAVYEKTRQSICISLSTNLATLPIVANTFYKISRYSILINIIIVPLMSVILGIGIIVMIIGNTFVNIKCMQWLVILLLNIDEKIIDIYSFLCENTTRLLGNYWVIGECEWWQNVVYITIIVAGICLFDIYRIRTRNNDKLRERYRKKIALSETILALFAVLILTIRNYPEMSINVLSVGQGACNVIFGKNTPTIMIDGGSTDVKDVYSYRIEPFLLSKGIDKIDYLFISHADEDHISGIKEMLNDQMICIHVSKIFINDSDELCKLVIKDEKDVFNENNNFNENNKILNGINIYEINKGDKIKKGYMQIECISAEKTDTENDNSVVLKMTYFPSNFEALFTGDISAEIEKKIIDKSIKNLDFMTAAHHGSKYSSCDEFISCVSPKITTISSGKNNSYGHPHKETLDRLDKFAPNSKVVRTDESGQITVCVENGIKIKRFK